ncbi:hypothetical protein TNCV_2121521 [Trichonephila clavipes]|nr:hypothetical protein TNCV_2121521 [Trichonephila clavipes]
MPLNSRQKVHMEYVLVKSVGPKILWEPRVQRAGEYFPPLQFHAKIVKVEISGVTIYRAEVQLISGAGDFHSFPSGRKRLDSNIVDVYINP